MTEEHNKIENLAHVLSISIIIGFFLLGIFTYLGLDSINQAIREGTSLQKQYMNLIGLGNQGEDRQAQQPTQPTAGNQPQAQPQQRPKVEASADDDPVLGNKDAKVTIIEFSDFQCPFCARFYNDAYKQIKENYVKTGKVKIIYRDFPLSFHPYAQKAAEATECADEQGKFWEYHDILFEKQNEWSGAGVSKFKEYAQTLGLDTTKFNNCLDSGKYAAEVQKDFQDGQASGVSGTPTAFVNGKMIVGAQPYSVFQQAIEQELSK